MVEKENSKTGFDQRRAPEDPWVSDLLEKHGLAPDAPLVEIEPKVRALWINPSTRFDAVELALGRRIDGSEISQDPFLGSIMATSDPAEVFGGLLLLRATEEHESTHTMQ